jgi:hypothetical protein
MRMALCGLTNILLTPPNSGFQDAYGPEEETHRSTSLLKSIKSLKVNAA